MDPVTKVIVFGGGGLLLLGGFAIAIAGKDSGVVKAARAEKKVAQGEALTTKTDDKGLTQCAKNADKAAKHAANRAPRRSKADVYTNMYRETYNNCVRSRN